MEGEGTLWRESHARPPAQGPGSLIRTVVALSAFRSHSLRRSAGSLASRAAAILAPTCLRPRQLLSLSLSRAFERGKDSECHHREGFAAIAYCHPAGTTTTTTRIDVREMMQIQSALPFPPPPPSSRGALNVHPACFTLCRATDEQQGSAHPVRTSRHRSFSRSLACPTQHVSACSVRTVGAEHHDMLPHDWHLSACCSFLAEFRTFRASGPAYHTPRSTAAPACSFEGRRLNGDMASATDAGSARCISKVDPSVLFNISLCALRRHFSLRSCVGGEPRLAGALAT